MATQTAEKKQTATIIARLKKAYPDAHCALDHRTPLQLLIATILSAQCTDVRVNMVTPELFKRFPDAASLAAANITNIEQIIRSTGFYRAKARAIQQTAKLLVERYNGKVPDTMESLTSLSGVGRKTANVVLGNAFGKNVGIVVDTHVGRISRRLGLTRQDNPEKVEQDLMKLVPQKQWALFAHLLIFHGRQVCFARKPDCESCTLADLCPSAFKIAK
ncbi:MAG TPA: endonuclease III [Phycisphaerae bacterium]|nr:endonuclease III [Phycisphaerae bacterium]